MRMRFCATMRRPAFSITAFTAPVRLRAVASGLIIEKVRSMAMILSLEEKAVVRSCRAYIGAVAERQATAGTPSRALRRRAKVQDFTRDYTNFTQMNPI